ncbi:hypothetical protein BLNAU_24824 [Blattamonas nauphoetae]|uniref:Peptidase A2 domain-containing protein n=1 Tax=Blattamonas nauphoetae TaxID=2049346 RepID=A0ABQ9WLD9_9EUKA|nr:hypothetical protein BLNAU_24824 [Blattamonas nauphoetae]
MFPDYQQFAHPLRGKDTSHLRHSAQSARDEEEGSGLSGDVERAKSENAELDATLDAGASDTILVEGEDSSHTRDVRSRRRVQHGHTRPIVAERFVRSEIGVKDG